MDAASAERVVTVPLLKLCGGATEVVAGEHTVVSHWVEVVKVVGRQGVANCSPTWEVP